MKLVTLLMVFMALSVTLATEKKKKHRHRIIKETLKSDSQTAQQIENTH